MKLKSLQIENFQSHKRTFIEFADGITVIIGDSNAGKTAVLRALDWLRLNRPRGLSFIRKDQKETTVTLETDEHQIGRTKSKKKNEYFLSDGGEISEFKVVGNDVPAEVSQALRLTDLNVHRQFDSHYLLFDSPGEIARTIHAACRLDKGVAAVEVLAGKLRKVKAQRGDAESELENVSAQLGSPELTILPEVGRELAVVELLAGDVGEKSKRLKRLRELVERLDTLDDEIEKLRLIVAPVARLLKSAFVASKALEEKSGRIIRLRELKSLRIDLTAVLGRSKAIASAGSLVLEAESVSSALEGYRERFSRLSGLAERYGEAKAVLACKVRISSAGEELSQAERISTTLLESRRRRTQLGGLVERLDQHDDAAEVAEKARDELRVNLAEYSVANPECPECGAPLGSGGVFDSEIIRKEGNVDA